MEKEPRKRNPAFIRMGIAFIGAGIALSSSNPGLLGITGLGVVFLIMGIAGKKADRFGLK
ncbi:MAG TPA: hypothetical protein VGB30_12595 [bacterium]|jgi:hypothetical protein